MGLKEYKKKRNFGATPEPDGEGQAGEGELLRHPEARGEPPALRLPAGDGRGAAELGGAQGAEPRSRREAAGGPGRGPSDRLRRLRGDHPQGAVRRRHRDALGPRHLDARRATRRGLQEGAPQVPPRRREAPRRLGAGAHGRRATRRREHENWLLIKETDDAAVPGSDDAVVEEIPRQRRHRPEPWRRSPPTPSGSGSRTAPRRPPASRTRSPPRPPSRWRRRRRQRRPRKTPRIRLRPPPRSPAPARRRCPPRSSPSSRRWSTRCPRGDGVDPRDQVRRLPRALRDPTTARPG